MNERLLPWGGSLLLHCVILAGLALIDTRLHEPVQINLFDFELLPTAPATEQPGAKVETVAPVPPAAGDSAETEPAHPPPPRPAPQPTAIAAATPAPVKKSAPPAPLPAENAPVPDPRPVEAIPSPPKPSAAAAEMAPVFPETVMGKTLPAAGTANALVPSASGAQQAAATTPGAQREAYLAVHFGYIRDKVLTRLAYPHQARRMGWGGRVRVSFVILESGAIEELRIEESSGHKVLDRQALRAVEKAAPFPPPPVPASISLPVVFRLE